MPRKTMQRVNPRDFRSISDPRKTDVFPPQLPLTATRYLSKTLIAFNTAVIEEWETTAPILTSKTTEEWQTPTPPSMSTLTTEEWANELISSLIVVENWQFEPIVSTLLTTEGW